jgi:hypothetical protein
VKEQAQWLYFLVLALMVQQQVSPAALASLMSVDALAFHAALHARYQRRNILLMLETDAVQTYGLGSGLVLIIQYFARPKSETAEERSHKMDL